MIICGWLFSSSKDRVAELMTVYLDFPSITSDFLGINGTDGAISSL